MKPFVLITLSLVLVAPASARLGETIEQLTARFGPPTKEKPEPKRVHSLLFQTPTWSVFVEMLDGKSVSELYGHINNAPLNDAEIETLLTTLADGQKFTPDKAAKKHYERTDGRVRAIADSISVFVFDVSAVKELDRIRAAASTKGF
jgi:hypothetical protein